MNDVKARLLDVRNLLEDCWIQGVMAANNKGIKVPLTSQYAEKFCLLGACERVMSEEENDDPKAITDILHDVAFGHDPGFLNNPPNWTKGQPEKVRLSWETIVKRRKLADWNDSKERQHSDVLELLDEAIDSLE